MSRKALIVWGGWDGHQPKEVGALFARWLAEDGFEVDLPQAAEVAGGVDEVEQRPAHAPHRGDVELAGRDALA